MKILYVITKSEIGGAQTHLLQLVSYFHTKGDDLYVMSSPGGWLEKEISGKAIFLPNHSFSNSLNPIRAFRAIVAIINALKIVRPDLVHCHSSGAATFARLAMRGKIPTIYTAHGWGFNIGTSWFQRTVSIIVERILAPFTDKIICVAEFVKDLGVKYRIADDNKFVVVYNGVKNEGILRSAQNDTNGPLDSRIRGNDKERGGNDNKHEGKKKIQLITVGRLAEPKIPETLVQILKELPTKVKEIINLLILGDGPKKESLKSVISNDLDVELKSVTPDLVQTNLKNSDIFVLLSRWEGFPYTVLEAMALGLPVVASNVGGIKEAIENGKNGYLVENGDIVKIKSSILELISNSELRRKMGDEGRKIIEEKFSEKEMLEKTEGIYKEVLRK